MTWKNDLAARGISNYQTTTSLTAGLFSRTTKTPHTEYETHVKENGVEWTQLDHRKAATVRTRVAINSSASGHKQFTARNMQDHAATLMNVNAWDNTLTHRQAYLFPDSDAPQIEALRDQLHEVQKDLTRTTTTAPVPEILQAPNKEARVLPGTPMTVLLNSVANATRLAGLTADDAAKAIACLKQIHVFDAIANPHSADHNGVPDGFQRKDVANAWRLAIELERSGEAGFTMLKKLMYPQLAHPGENPAVGRQRDALLHTYLHTAREMVGRVQTDGPGAPPTDLVFNGKLSPDPRSLHRYVNSRLNPPNTDPATEPGIPRPYGDIHSGHVLPGNATLLDKSLKATSNHLKQVQDHAASTDTNKKLITFDRHCSDVRQGLPVNVLKKDANWWAANAVRNGIYSEDSPEYQRLQGRTKKVVTWMQRANGDGQEPVTTRKGKIARKAKRALTPAKWSNKTPFRAMNDIVAASPHRLEGGTGASGITEGQIIRQDLIWMLEKAIENNGGANIKVGQATVVDNADWNVLRQMVRAAILNHQSRFNKTGANGRNLFITRHDDGDPVKETDIDRVKAAIYGMFTGGKGAQDPETVHMIDHLFKEENQHISPERLLAWAADVGAPQRFKDAINDLGTGTNRQQELRRIIEDDEVTLVGNEDDDADARTLAGDPIIPPTPNGWTDGNWKKFIEGAETVLLQRWKKTGNVEKDLTEISTTDAAKMFEQIIQNQRLGHVVELKDGGWTGLKTQGLSYALSHVASLKSTFGALSVGVGIDVRLQKGRHAVMQSSIGTAGREVFVGTSDAWRGQLGTNVSATVGPGHVSKKAGGTSFGVGGSGGGSVSAEFAERVGAVWRFRRVFSGVDSDDIGARQEGRLVRKMMDPGTDPTDAEGGAWTNPPGEGDDPDIIKQILHEFDDVSGNWLKSDTQTYKGNLSVNGMVGGKVGTWGPGVSAGIAAEVTHNRVTQTEVSGSLVQERVSKGTETKVTVSGVLTLIAATLQNLGHLAPNHGLHHLLDPELWNHAIKMSFHDGMVGSVDVARGGTAKTHSWIYHDGALTYTAGICSFYQKTHKNAISYVNSLLDRLGTLAHDKAKAFDSVLYHPATAPEVMRAARDKLANTRADLESARGTPQEAAAQEKVNNAQAALTKLEVSDQERERAIDIEITKLLEHMSKVLKEAKPTQEFREYFEWSGKFLQMINDLEAQIKSEKANPGWENNRDTKDRVKAYETELKKLKSLDDKAVRKFGEFRFGIKDNAESKTKNLGLNAGVLSWGETVFNAKRIDVYD